MCQYWMSVIIIIIIIITVDRLDSKDNIKLMLSVITQWAEKLSYLCNSLPKQPKTEKDAQLNHSFCNSISNL